MSSKAKLGIVNKETFIIKTIRDIHKDFASIISVNIDISPHLDIRHSLSFMVITRNVQKPFLKVPE